MKMHGTKVWVFFALTLFVIMNHTAANGGSMKGDDETTVSAGKEISIEYTLRLEDKSVADSNVGSEPLVYTHGAYHIIPGLEKGLEGMKAGESKEVTVTYEEGYGKVDQEAFLEVNKKELPTEALKIGAQVQGEGANGRILHARVTEIKEQTVVLDFNHPLAGKTLYFDVKVLDIHMVPAGR